LENKSSVLEYKCPCCGAGLVFGQEQQQMRCPYCDNTFDLDTVKAYNDQSDAGDSQDFQWEESRQNSWTQEDQTQIRSFLCPACAGEILTDEHTAATFCPYCGNPSVLPGRVSGGLKPDGVIPFKTGKEDAKAAFLKLCKGKPLLPKLFTEEQQVEKITGLYVPFWLYDCSASFDGAYTATRLHFWSDTRYQYTKTDHYMLKRSAEATYSGIPMDGSTKMDDVFMESIEPFDYSDIVDFDMAYLSGFYADKYDVPSERGQERIRQRVETSMYDKVQESLIGYSSVIPTSRNLSIQHGNAKYVLLPVWILNTRYKDKIYTFAMNGQTGKMTGAFPVCPKRTAIWFSGIWAACTALVSLIQLMM